MTLAESWHVFRRNSRRYLDLPLYLSQTKAEAQDTLATAERQGRWDVANRMRWVIKGIDADLVTWKPFGDVLEQDRLTLAALDFSLPTLGDIQQAGGYGFWEGLKSTPFVGSLVEAGSWLGQKLIGHRQEVQAAQTTVYAPEAAGEKPGVAELLRRWMAKKVDAPPTPPSVWDMLGIPWYVWLFGTGIAVSVMVARR